MRKPKIRADKLLRLAEHLETQVKPRFFNMEVWAETEECGTVACAAGHACSIPEFRRAGFKIVYKSDGNLYPQYRGRESFDAIDKFFGLTDADTDFIFSKNSYPSKKVTPKMVARRIRKLVQLRAGGEQ